MALGVIIRISAFEYLPAQQRHTWSLCFSLSIGLSVRNNSLIVVPAHLQVRQDWLEANVFYSKHYLLDARSRDVTKERRAFWPIPSSDYFWKGTAHFDLEVSSGTYLVESCGVRQKSNDSNGNIYGPTSFFSCESYRVEINILCL